MQPMLNIALRAARNAGEQIVRAVERLDLIKSEQSDVASFVSETCKKAELSIVHTIQKAYPQHRVVGTHTGEHAPTAEGEEIVWQINPIDNLTSFSNGLPAFALSIAGSQNGRLEHSVVLNPMSGEEFTASRGRGAQLNGKRIRVSSKKTLDNALLGTGFLNRASDRNHLNTHLEMVKTLTVGGSNLHSSGSASLNLAHLAAGRFDGFFQIGLIHSEIEAALLLVQEAGGLTSGFSGNSNFKDSGHLVAGNAKILKATLQTIRPALTPELS